MRILRELTPSEAPAAVALGFFDGVHRGHRAVLGSAAACKPAGLVPAAFTFSHTPKPGDRNMQLNTFDKKAALLEEIGIELLYVIDFEKVKSLSPERFVSGILKDTFSAKRVFCGFNYRFASGGKGTTDDLKLLCRDEGILAEVCAPVTVDGLLASSTEIRKRLKSGDIRTANCLLGYEYGYSGRAVEGNHIGTEMRTPTINLNLASELVLPRFGVYASLVSFDGEEHIGVTNIGVKPTIGDYNAPNCETWLPKYKGGALYGKKIDVRLIGFIREEKRFSNLAGLQSAIRRDGALAVRIIEGV